MDEGKRKIELNAERESGRERHGKLKQTSHHPSRPSIVASVPLKGRRAFLQPESTGGREGQRRSGEKEGAKTVKIYLSWRGGVAAAATALQNS